MPYLEREFDRLAEAHETAVPIGHPHLGLEDFIAGKQGGEHRAGLDSVPAAGVASVL